MSSEPGGSGAEHAGPTPIVPPDALAALAAHDPGVIAALRDARVELERRSGLDERTIELARIAALVALGAPAESFHAHVRRARTAGARAEEIWGAVISVATLVGVPALINAVPAIAEGLG